MITEDIKAQCIAKLARGFSPEDISEEMGVPTKLLKEWKSTLAPNQMISLHANLHAAAEMAAGNIEILEPNKKEQLLKDKLETVAVEIIEQTSLAVSTGDIVRAKTLQLCADVTTKLYATFITKGQGIPQGGGYNPGQGGSAFQRLMKD